MQRNALLWQVRGADVAVRLLAEGCCCCHRGAQGVYRSVQQKQVRCPTCGCTAHAMPRAFPSQLISTGMYGQVRAVHGRGAVDAAAELAQQHMAALPVRASTLSAMYVMFTFEPVCRVADMIWSLHLLFTPSVPPPAHRLAAVLNSPLPPPILAFSFAMRPQPCHQFCHTQIPAFGPSTLSTFLFKPTSPSLSSIPLTQLSSLPPDKQISRLIFQLLTLAYTSLLSLP